MSYIRSYPVRISGDIPRGQLRAGGLGDFIDDLKTRLQTSDELACLKRANASPQVVAIDVLIDRLAKSWHPTGYYRPSEVQTLLDTLASEAADAGAALAAAPLSTSDAEAIKQMAFNDMLRRYKDRSRAYERAVVEAKQKAANVINAPALKDWVISSMRSISDAYVTATMLHCRQSWVETWLDRAYRAAVAIGAVAARILGIVKKLGEAAVDAVDKAGDLLAFLIKYGPYALGGLVLYNLVKKR